METSGNIIELDDKEELEETKSLLTYMIEQDKIHHDKYHVPPSIYPGIPPEVSEIFRANNMGFAAFLLEQERLIVDTATFDMRCEYTNISTIITFNYAHAYLLLLDHHNTKGVEWFRNRFGDIYKTDEHSYTRVSMNTINIVNRNWYFTYFHQWEYTLRALVAHFQKNGRNIAKYSRQKNGGYKETKAKLSAGDSFSTIWLSLIKMYLQHKSQESDTLFNLNVTIRNCVHNFMVYKPVKESEESLTFNYKGRTFSFTAGKPVSFLYPSMCRFLIKELYNFMISLFDHEEIHQEKYIATYISKFQ